MSVDPIVWALVSLFLGILARIFVPFIKERRDNPELTWDWKYTRGPVLAFVVVFLMLPLLIPNLADTIRNSDPQTIWLVGWGVGDIGREADKWLGGK